MRIALISFCDKDDSRSASIVDALLKAAEKTGGAVESFNGQDDAGQTKLSFFDYIAVVVKKKGLFSGNIPPRVKEFLAESGTVAGKKGAAFVISSGVFGNSKACANLMRVLEKEGLLLDYSDILKNREQAVESGKKIG